SLSSSRNSLIIARYVSLRQNGWDDLGQREIMNDVHNRRAFLRAAAAAGAAWAAADVAQIEEALAWAARQVEAGGATSLGGVETAEAGVIDAMTSRILPSVDGKPDAHEAGVGYF